MRAFHGKNEDVEPGESSRMMIRAPKQAGGDPRYTECPGVGHNCREKAYKDPKLFECLFAQKRR
jgi:hypothetical protein